MNKLKNDNLSKIITDTQNNVDGAFEQLYKETINFSYSIASLLLKNEEDIEDAVALIEKAKRPFCSESEEASPP